MCIFMSGGWHRYRDLFSITTFTDLSMLPDEGEDLCRDMEGLSITDLSMLPDEGEDLCRDMEGLSITDLSMTYLCDLRKFELCC